MKIPERNARPVDEAPLRRGEIGLPPVFHRVKRRSRVPGIVALAIGYPVSFFMLAIGAVGLMDNEIFAIGVVFALFGVGILGVTLKASWSMSNSSLIHVLTFDAEQIVWGYVGREERVPIGEVAAIDWHSGEGGYLTLSVRTYAGKRISFAYINELVSKKSRTELLTFLKANYPDVPLSVTDAG